MLKTRAIPCLLLQNKKLVKTVKFRNPQYIGDPVNAIKIYNEKEVDELVILDISATREKKKPPFALIEEIASECFMPLAYGGGIRNLEDMRKIFSLGVEKIVINTHALENPTFITQAAELFGNQAIVISIDVKKTMLGKYVVTSENGTKKTSYDPVTWAKRVEGLGAGEIMLTAIYREGTWEGYDLALIREVVEAVDIPVIARGGARTIEDFSEAERAGASAVAAGSMAVYQGPGLGVLINFPLREKLEHALH